MTNTLTDEERATITRVAQETFDANGSAHDYSAALFLAGKRAMQEEAARCSSCGGELGSAPVCGGCRDACCAMNVDGG